MPPLAREAFVESALGAFAESPLGVRGGVKKPLRLLACGERTTTYTGSDGSAKNVWLLDENLGLIRSWDSQRKKGTGDWEWRWRLDYADHVIGVYDQSDGSGDVVRIAPDGTEVWRTNIANSHAGGTMGVFNLEVAFDGDVLVASSNSGAVNNDPSFFRLSATDGSVIWSRRHSDSDANSQMIGGHVIRIFPRRPISGGDDWIYLITIDNTASRTGVFRHTPFEYINHEINHDGDELTDDGFLDPHSNKSNWPETTELSTINHLDAVDDALSSGGITKGEEDQNGNLNPGTPVPGKIQQNLEDWLLRISPFNDDPRATAYDYDFNRQLLCGTHQHPPDHLDDYYAAWDYSSDAAVFQKNTSDSDGGFTCCSIGRGHRYFFAGKGITWPPNEVAANVGEVDPDTGDFLRGYETGGELSFITASRMY